MARATFHLETRPLNIEYSKWGEIGVVPWDSAIFGFPVANFNAGEIAEAARDRVAFQRSLEDWAKTYDVELIGCSVPVESAAPRENQNEDVFQANWSWLLSQTGWTVVEQALRVTLTGLQTLQFKADLPVLRLAQAQERTAVENIAAHAFRHGRYCADVRFPMSLAQLRYLRWMSNAFDALEEGDETTRVYLIGAGTQVDGFMHVNVVGDVADLRLAAVNSATASARSGYNLYNSTLLALQQSGVRRVTSKIAASNIAVMKLYTALGFRFSEPEWVFHWHAPNAPHLILTE